MSSATVLPMYPEDYQRESYARASEWTMQAAETHHRLIERTTTIARKRSTRRSGHWIYGYLATWRRHVLENPACPRCKQIVRRELRRYELAYGPVPS